MKTIIYLIFIIAWAVLQARRKAMREAKRKEAEAQKTNEFIRQTPPLPAVRGPVTAEENRLISMDEPKLVPVEEMQPSYLNLAPKEVQQFVEALRPKKKKKQKPVEIAPQDDEKVEEIVRPFDMGPDAYSQTAPIRREIGFDPASLRTFVVTREILGPPRAKRPHRPGVKQK